MTDDQSNKSIVGQIFDCVIDAIKKAEWKRDKSVCPPKKKRKPRRKCSKPKSEKIEEEVIIIPPRIDDEYRPEIFLPQIKKKVCRIKMQDPYAPCCCKVKPELPPCLPKSHLPRKPICGCDLCEKNPNHGCCRPAGAFRGIGHAKCFEEA